MNVISILIGIVCFVLMALGMIPFLGWIQWLTMAAAVIGIIFGALSKEKAGLYINVSVLVVAIIRTMMGGGII